MTLPNEVYAISQDLSKVVGNTPNTEVVPFDGIDQTVGLKVPWELSLPDPVVIRADSSEIGDSDFPCNDRYWPIMSERMLDTIRSVGEFSHNVYAVEFHGITSDKSFFAVQLTEQIDAFDSEESRWKPSFLPDEVGFVEKYALVEPETGFPPLFRLKATPRHLLVTLEAKEALEFAEIRGIEFTSIDKLH